MAKDTKTRMLDATARLLQLRGYHGTALNDILAESGAPRGSLYFHFPGGKDQLVLEATRLAVEGITRQRRDILEQAATPADAVRDFAERTAALLRESDYTLSCPIAPIVLDGTKDIPELAELCRQTFEEWISLLGASLAGNGIPQARADALALTIQSSFEGVLMIARAYRDASPVTTVGEQLSATVEAALCDAASGSAAARAAR